MKKKTINKRKISRECYALDYAFYEWLRERLPVYLKEAGKAVDLNFHRFEYKGEQYTQRELIERMIYLLRSLDGNCVLDEDWEKSKEVLEIWAIIAPAMWW